MLTAREKQAISNLLQQLDPNSESDIDLDLYDSVAKWLARLLKEYTALENEMRPLNNWKQKVLTNPRDRLWVDSKAAWFSRVEDGNGAPYLTEANAPEKMLNRLINDIKQAFGIRGR